MAIEKVTAEIGNNLENLEEKEESIYSGNIVAPRESGTYSAIVKAYDYAGRFSSAESNEIEVTTWRNPKTDWTINDKFNWKDYNRIKNNLRWLHEKACELYLSFEIENMGDDIIDYSSYWNVEFFNAIENNLDTINQNIFTQNHGNKQKFYENGIFIKWDELNRIESATLKMKKILENQEIGLRRIPFKLGNFKEVRI